jgi:hypothetical protein
MPESPEKESPAMRAQQVNRISGKIVVVLSLIALVTVLTGYLQPAHTPEKDEGTGAHVFQLSIVMLAPVLLLFLATADRRQSWRSVRPLAIPAVLLALAFAALYYLEHIYLAQ